MVRRILVARAADSNNHNPQAKNAQSILRYWRSSEYRPYIVTFGEPDPAVARNPNVEIVKLSASRFWPLALTATYVRQFDAIFYPGLHVWADWLGLNLRARLRSRAVVISTMEGLLGEVGNDAHERKYAAVAGHDVYCQRVSAGTVRRAEAISSKADHIIAISPFLARIGESIHGSKVSMLPLGVDTAVFSRSAFETPSRPRVICAAGVRAHKRPEFFLNLACTFPQADFLWVGEGELRQPLTAQAISEGLTNVKFVGALPHEALAREYSQSDIFILPSRNEGVPKVTQEAAASGLAQIIFGFYEAPTVINGKNGFVVWDDDEFTARLGTLINDPGMVRNMGQTAILMAEEWSWAKVAPQWEQRIIEVVEGQKFPRNDSI